MKLRKTGLILLAVLFAVLLAVPFLTKYSIAPQEALLATYENIFPLAENTYYRVEKIAISRNKMADPFIKYNLENAKKNLNQGMADLAKAKSIMSEMEKMEKNIFSIKFLVTMYSMNTSAGKVDRLIKDINRQALAVSEYLRNAIQDMDMGTRRKNI